VSEGWWTYVNGECSEMTARYLRIRAASEGGWALDDEPTSDFCVKSEVFEIFSPMGRSSCDTAGGYMATFSSVPSGSGTYQYNLGPSSD
jgi:uncharacterized membrane protein